MKSCLRKAIVIFGLARSLKHAKVHQHVGLARLYKIGGSRDLAAGGAVDCDFHVCRNSNWVRANLEIVAARPPDFKVSERPLDAPVTDRWSARAVLLECATRCTRHGLNLTNEPSRRGGCALRLLQACHQPALGVAVVEMDQDAGCVLSQVAQSGFHQRARLVLCGPGGALRLLVY